MRNEGWEELISKVIKICNKHDIDVLGLDAPYVQVKNLSAMLQLRMFLICIIIGMIVCFGVVDLQLQELNIRFDEEREYWTFTICFMFDSYIIICARSGRVIIFEIMLEMFDVTQNLHSWKNFQIFMENLKKQISATHLIATTNVEQVFVSYEVCVKSQMSNNNKLFNDRPVTCVCNVNVLSLIFIDA